MSPITRMLLPAVIVIALCGVVTSSAFAVEDPFYKVSGKRLFAKEAREVVLHSEGNQVLRSAATGVRITCPGIEAAKGATINGSEAGEPGKSAGVIVYWGCSVEGNGEKCIVTSVAKAKNKKIVTTALNDKLALNSTNPEKGTRILDFFTPAKEKVFAEIKFDPEPGGKCNFTEAKVEGSVAFQILNWNRETVAFGEHEEEEFFGYIRALPNSTQACELKGGELVFPCPRSELKMFTLSGATLEGTAELSLNSIEVFGVFSK